MVNTRKNVVKRPLIELIEELKTKIALLEGDRRAYYESSYFTMQKNRDKIGALRKELYDLRRQLRERTHTDDSVISQAFQNRPVEKSAFLCKTSQQAIAEMDFRVSDTMKRYNYTKYITQMKRKTLEQLKIDYADAQAEDASCRAELALDLPQSQKIRDMENRLDKLILKCNESEFIRKTYEQIYQRLYEEHVRSNRTLDELEADIRRCRAEKTDLLVMHRDSIAGKELTLAELRRHEEYIYADRKRREIEVSRMRKVAEENKLENERVEKKAVDEVLDDEAGETGQLNEDEMKHQADDESDLLDGHEENLEKLRQVTGIPDLNGIVSKFESQLDIKHKLITLINNMEANINKYRQDRASQQTQLTDLKTTIETKSAKVQQIVIQKKDDVALKTTQANAVTEDYNVVSAFTVIAKAGLEHLMEKLMHVRTKEKFSSVKPHSAEEYIIDIFKRIRCKLNNLMQELSAYDIDEYMEKMKTEEEVLVIPQMEIENSLQKKVPTYNLRVKAEHVKDTGDVDDESGEDVPDWKSREMMKTASAEFIEMKTKKKNRRKKKMK